MALGSASFPRWVVTEAGRRVSPACWCRRSLGSALRSPVALPGSC